MKAYGMKAYGMKAYGMKAYGTMKAYGMLAHGMKGWNMATLSISAPKVETQCLGIDWHPNIESSTS